MMSFPRRRESSWAPAFAGVTVLLLSFASPAIAADVSSAHRLYFQGNSEEALEIYRAALEMEPTIDAALNAMVVAQELGHHREAIRFLERTLKVHPDSFLLQRELGWAYLNEGKISEARPYLETALEKAPDDAAVLWGAAWLALEQNEWPAAEERLNHLVVQEPKFTPGHYFRGRLLEAQNNLEGAVASYREVLKRDSHAIEVRPLLAGIYERTGRPEDAWREYARITYAAPAVKKAQQGLDKLAASITQTPAEIIPPQTISGHTRISPVSDRERLPVLKVGIGTTAGGQPTPKKFIAFRTAQPFSVLDSKSKAVIARGERGEKWTVRISAKGKVAEIVDPRGILRSSFSASILLQQENGQATTILNSLRFAPGTIWGGMADRELRGEIEIVFEARRKRLVVINHVNLEEYVYGVLAAEMPSHWPMEALKCQAVIARNIAVYRQRRLKLHRRSGYDICDEQHCQVYTGVAVENEKVRAAVDDTRGEILLHEGKPAHAVFSSNCGGETEAGAAAGWGHLPYWKTVPDFKSPAHPPRTPWELKEWLRGSPPLYCQASSFVWAPESRWARVVPAEDIAGKISRIRRLGRVKQIYILKRSSTGRVRRVRIIGTNGEIVFKQEHQIRKYLGLASLRSTFFVMDTVVREGKAHSFVFSGGGWGHGVGLCQSGAAGRAEEGASYRDILSHYYPGTTLERLSD